jgi:hypothetical protein
VDFTLKESLKQVIAQKCFEDRVISKKHDDPLKYNTHSSSEDGQI